MNLSKITFSFLCLAFILLNGYTHSAGQAGSTWDFIGIGILWSLILIPIWSLAGMVLYQFLMVICQILKPDEQLVLSIWHMVNLGLAVGIIFKFTFGILLQ